MSTSGYGPLAGANLTGIADPEMPRALFVTYGVLDADLYDKRHVAIVSENLAREFWGDRASQ